MSKKITVLIALLSFSTLALALSMDDLFAHFNPGGKLTFSAAAGETLWNKDFISAEDGKTRNCHTCHNKDHTKAGKHAKSGKVIDPMARSVNPERYTDLEKVEKWFKRNCKWVMDRECTLQEKGDVLKYLTQF